jgi:hypothetical protein
LITVFKNSAIIYVISFGFVKALFMVNRREMANQHEAKEKYMSKLPLSTLRPAETYLPVTRQVGFSVQAFL